MKSLKLFGRANWRGPLALAAMVLMIGTLLGGTGAVLRSDDTVLPQQFGVFDAVTSAQALIQGPSVAAHLSGNGTAGDFSPLARARAMAVGDFNGDGIPDIIIGAPDATVSITAGMTTTTRAGAGSVFIFFGGSSFPGSATLDTNQASVQILGANPGDHLGFSVSIGDVNGDGIDDIAIGATGFSANGTTRQTTGAVFVLFGSHTPAATVDLATANAADVSILGIAHNDAFGTSVAIGNVGGSPAQSAADQGVKDIFVGAPGFSGPTPGQANAGGAFVVFGGSRLNRTAGATTVLDLSVPATAPDVELLGKDTGDAMGASVAIGNITGGTLGMLIAGAPAANRPANATQPAVPAASNTGAVYGFQGGTNLNPGASLPKILDVSSEQQNFSFYGATANDRAGYSVAAGDVTGDGTADLLIGAPAAGTVPLQAARAGAGQVYVLLGGARLNPGLGLGDRRIDALIDVTTPADPANLVNLTVLGAAGDQLGTTVSTGLFNPANFSGSIADVLIGSPGAGSGAGSVSVLVGTATLLPAQGSNFRDNVLNQDDFRINGRAGMNVGIAVAAADINHDGAGDLLVGGPFADVTLPATRAGAGTAFFLAGTTPMTVPNITVALTSPNGGDVLQVGQTVNINWTVTDPNGNNHLNRFQLLLSVDGGASFNFTIANNLVGTARTFAWTVPGTVVSAQGRIQINAFDDVGATGTAQTAANFTITDLGVPVTLVTPNGTETLRFGQTFLITWTVPQAAQSRVKGFDLFFSSDGGLTFPLKLVSGPDPSQPALGPTTSSFSWTVPSFCTTTARIAVTATSTSNVRTQSSDGISFAIKDNGPTIDTTMMSVDTSVSRAIFFIATPQQGAEVDFSGSTVVEISTDATGTQFVTFAKPFKIKKAGKKLITRGPINGQDLLDFFPNGAVRFIRFTNPTCAVTLLKVMRNNDQLTVAQ
ncbi:MAG TPA: hypothetical protein VKJ45_16820 [Blastocatellia bacterium]|nr:hypothetical protein [Blastocatellia bacterium]